MVENTSGNPTEKKADHVLDFDIIFETNGTTDIKAKNKYTDSFFKLINKTKFTTYLSAIIKNAPMHGFTAYRIRNEIENVYAFLRSNGIG